VAHLAWLRGQIAAIAARLARPLGAKADRRAGLVRGYATRAEWHAKARRLQALKDRLVVVEADWAARCRCGAAASGGPDRGGGRGGHERRSSGGLAAGRARQSGRRAAALLLRPVGQHRAPGRADPARAERLLHYTRRCGAAAIAIEDLDFTEAGAGSSTAAQALPPAALPLPHRETQGPAGCDDRRAGRGHRRGRPRLHLLVGCPALAETADHPGSQDGPARCGEHRGRATRPRTPDPAGGTSQR
jgi:hypothetical protein